MDAIKPENNVLNTQYDFYKMVKKRCFLEKLRGAPRDEVPYALSLTSFDSVNRVFDMDAVITHPYTQYSRVHQEIREFVLPDEIGADFNWLRGGTGKYLIFSLGEAMATRTTIHALRNLPSDIHSVYTVAINKRSQNIAKRYSNL